MAEQQRPETVPIRSRLWLVVEGERSGRAFVHRRHWEIRLEVPRAALGPRRDRRGADTGKPA
jgi:hypothetical protein